MRRSQTVLVESEGVVLFPESLREELGLKPGDILSVKGAPPLCFSIEVYREMLTCYPAIMDQDALKGFVLRFLTRPLTAVEQDHRVLIPPEVFRLHAGSRLTLFLDGESCHTLQAFVDI
jgi:hypothetical protein